MSTRLVTFFESAARTLSVALVLALLATAGLWYALQRGSQRTVTAYFDNTVGLYVDNEVTIQGIPVGSVDAIVPQGDIVRVVLKVDNEAPVRADAQAVIVAPTLVSDRYVQLGPTYQSGPQLADGAVIPVERTSTPVELDRVYQSLDQIARSLGPNGANRAGALNQLLRSSAGALGGNGELLKSTITELGGAVGTLADNRDNLFATVDNLGQFTNMLARNDGAVRDLNNQLADISGFLASERGNLSTVLRTLPPALDDVARFIRDNRDILRTDVGRLRNITDILVRQRRAITEFTNVAPLALGNLTNSYNARSGTLDVRPVLAPELLGAGLDPRALLCSLLANQPGLPDVLAGPIDPLLTNVARASVVCGALLGGTNAQGQVVNQSPLGLSLAPIQDLLGLLNQQPSLNALVPLTALAGGAPAGAGGQAAGADGAATNGDGGATGAPDATPTEPGSGILGFETVGGDR
ncbi:virulence factor Mce-like protein [Actinomycetospora succinea]|uniref:Virulence factor Mce-like protein n=1 Tax=Actinomycetospora succinea TaxID=663603 RepID=A0A4R6UNS8_9PSEU|nr:MCE family protein [Actinomycetospora succinea]TDQ47886.1 virulence factor Mce-like protein [Actinomycetospora succinea]